MIRTEMLKILHSVPFNVLWPDTLSCDDIGFTEHPIWIDGKGYGYYFCDQPCTYYEMKRIPDKRWRDIRQKLTDDILSIKDLEGTPLMTILEDYQYDADDYICDQLLTLLNLPERTEDFFYCGFDEDEPHFYNSKEELVSAISRIHNDHNTCWEELSDEQLQHWIEGLQEGGYDQGFNFYDRLR